MFQQYQYHVIPLIKMKVLFKIQLIWQGKCALIDPVGLFYSLFMPNMAIALLTSILIASLIPSSGKFSLSWCTSKDFLTLKNTNKDKIFRQNNTLSKKEQMDVEKQNNILHMKVGVREKYKCRIYPTTNIDFW